MRPITYEDLLDPNFIFDPFNPQWVSPLQRIAEDVEYEDVSEERVETSNNE